MIVHSNKQPGRNWTSSNLEDLRSGLRYRASSSTTGDQPQFRGQEFIHAKTFSKLIPKHLSLYSRLSSKPKKGFTAQSLIDRRFLKPKKGFIAFSQRRTLALRRLQSRFSSVAFRAITRLGLARGLQVFTAPKMRRVPLKTLASTN